MRNEDITKWRKNDALEQQRQYNVMEKSNCVSDMAKFIFRRNAYYGTISEVESKTKRDFPFERRCY